MTVMGSASTRLEALAACVLLVIVAMEHTVKVRECVVHACRCTPYHYLHTDENECDSDAHDCDSKAYCTNTIGSFNCTCNSGYEGSGTNCLSK